MANITRFTPFEQLVDFPKGFWLKPFAFPAQTELAIKLDVKEDDRSYTVRAETKQEKEQKQGEKTICSERSYGIVSRSFSLPAEVDAQGAKAECKDGVLNLVLPKKANGSGKRIAVS